ncbi:MAG: peptidoglycan DD-metalloendopeptidase family protein [Tannerella sp.]|nr:peptidoglycan DD-metalloendopeptidase family protein [Tannerella sp.]
MRILNTFFICFSFIIGVSVNVEGQEQKAADETSTNARLQKQISELMANRVTSANIMSDELAIAGLRESGKLLATENLMFPADELYNSNWDTVHVNPFMNTDMDFPDSYNINCVSFVMPIDRETIRITSKYGPRRRRMHRGIDLGLQVGDTVRAAFDGKVRIKSYERRGYGYYLVLRHPNGLETVYGHLSKFLVQGNKVVRAGEAIALGGSTGRSSGAHLHFETRFLGKDINPAEIIDFENKMPYKDEYVFHNVKINGRKSNIYSTSEDVLAVHRVKKGETLSHIARKYGISVAELCRLNGITQTSKLSIGQSIQFRTKQVTVEVSPDAVQASPSVQSSQPATQSSRPAAVKPQTPAANVKPSANEVYVRTSSTDGVSGEAVYHVIKSGDTLYLLSEKYGVSIEKLCELNNITRNTIMKIGQKIRCS